MFYHCFRGAIHLGGMSFTPLRQRSETTTWKPVVFDVSMIHDDYV
jgi:hypothetical protein